MVAVSVWWGLPALALLLSGAHGFEVVLGKYEKEANLVFDHIDMFVDLFERPEPEIVAKGFRWTEGPVWDDADEVLYFSDTQLNQIYVFDPKKKSVETFLLNAGGGSEEYTRQQVEPGPNGLVLYEDEMLILQHGGRSVSRLDMGFGLMINYVSGFPDRLGCKFNSPNDGVVYRDPENNTGDYLLFTDPPYGLINLSHPVDHADVDARSETNGSYVYAVKLDHDGVEEPKVTRLVGETMRPNGIDMSIDGRYMFLSECCQGHNASCGRGFARWHSYHINYNHTEDKIIAGNGPMTEQRFDYTTGCADGFKVVPNFRFPEAPLLLATCPGGLCLVDGRRHKVTEPLLSHLLLPKKASNVAVSRDGYLYITGEKALWRLRFKKKYRKLMYEGRYSYTKVQQTHASQKDDL